MLFPFSSCDLGGCGPPRRPHRLQRAVCDHGHLQLPASRFHHHPILPCCRVSKRSSSIDCLRGAAACFILGLRFLFSRSLRLTDGGSGYDSTQPPAVFISTPLAAGGVQATAVVAMAGGTGMSITSITVNNADTNWGYDDPDLGGNPTVFIGARVNVVVNVAGTGYGGVVPTLSFLGGCNDISGAFAYTITLGALLPCRLRWCARSLGPTVALQVAAVTRFRRSP